MFLPARLRLEGGLRAEMRRRRCRPGFARRLADGGGGVFRPRRPVYFRLWLSSLAVCSFFGLFNSSTLKPSGAEYNYESLIGQRYYIQFSNTTFSSLDWTLFGHSY